MNDDRAAHFSRFLLKSDNWLAQMEQVYLAILRGVVLLVATGLLLFGAYQLVTGIFKVSRSPDSVVEDISTVNGNELAAAEAVAVAETESSPREQVATREQQAFYAGFVKRYHALYQKQFEPFRQREDKQLARDEFDDSFVQTPARLREVASGALNFTEDRDELEKLLATMNEAASNPEIRQKLSRYKAAKKVKVERQVRRTRTEYRRGWDSYSTACPDWYYSPIGCAATRPVQVPYTATISALEFPKGTQSHTALFRSMQDRYFAMLTERRASAESKAAAEREAIVEGNYEGDMQISMAFRVAAMFVVLMFFFLLIAIERHQRRLARDIEKLNPQVSAETEA